MPGYNAAAEAAAPAILVRPEEAARMLRVSRSAIYALMQDGELPSITIGSRRRIPRAALDDYVTRRLAAAAADGMDPGATS
jgi:excisionase family DNA binding protein